AGAAPRRALRAASPGRRYDVSITRAALPMTLTPKQKQYLKALAHPLKPLVQVGTKGMGEGLFEQIATQLAAHELIKVRFNTESAVEPDEVAGELATRTQSEL